MADQTDAEEARAAALQYIALAQDKAGIITGIDAPAKPLPVNKVGIVGAGTMGCGIAINFLLAGIPTTLIETSAAALERGNSQIEKTIARNVSSGRLTESAAAEALRLLTTSLDYRKLSESDLIIEAAFETMAVKQEIFRQLDVVAKPRAILATNTSYLDVDAIAAITSRPEYVLGLHFFSPANIMKLLEIVRAAKTADAVLVSAIALARRIKKIPVVAGVTHGFIGNRMMAVRRREADQLMLKGVSPYRIDRVMENFGMPMGPFRISDLAGLDLGWNRETSKGETVRERLCERGRRGQKTGAGFYDYVDGRPKESSDVENLIENFAREKNITQESFTDGQILQYLLFPMINEGAKLLEENKAQRASDIDVVWVNGFGWPAWRGGPMYYADQIGLDIVHDWLATTAREPDGDRVTPSALLTRLVKERTRFSDLP